MPVILTCCGARAFGDRLVLGLNSDASVRALKGPDRPLVSQKNRRLILQALKYVDDVVIFDELTPERLIRELQPDILVKGGDWRVDQIAGAENSAMRKQVFSDILKDPGAFLPTGIEGMDISIFFEASIRLPAS